MCLNKHLWGVNVKLVLEYVTKLSGSGQKFRHLPEMCTKSSVRLGDLNSESFSERMTSSANLLVNTHHLKFGDSVIDKLTLLRMNKKIMDRMRSKATFSTMTFETMDANKRIKV